MYKHETVLITGGTGSWGHELTRQLLDRGVDKIVIFSRGELAQVKMAREFAEYRDRLVFRIGDVRDRDSIRAALLAAGGKVKHIFHLAALKHVPVCEFQPLEAVKTNIIGTQNVCEVAQEFGVDRVIDVSTDKAVAPMNLYGMTKAVGERLVIAANGAGTKYICIRGGNALGSNGSAIPLFISQVQKSNHITLTDNRMTRYFMTLPEAVGLIFKAAEIGLGGEVFVMRMPAFEMRMIAEIIAEHYGDGDTTISEIGIRPGEKIDEVLISKDEARLAYAYDDQYYLIIPDTMRWLKDSYVGETLKKTAKPFEMEEYTSATFLSNKDQATDILKKAGFLK